MEFTNEELKIIDSIAGSKTDICLKSLDALIRKTQKLVEHTVLYRGLSIEESQMMDCLIAGDSFVTERPTSFTPDIAIAQDFATEVYRTGKLIQIIPTRPCMNYYEHAIDWFSAKEYDSPSTRLQMYAMLADERECIYTSGTEMTLIEIEETKALTGDEIRIYKFSLK